MTHGWKQPKQPKFPAPPRGRRWWIAASGGLVLSALLSVLLMIWRWNRSPRAAPGSGAPPLKLPFLEPKYVARPAVKPIDGGVFLLENRLSALCLSVTDGSRERGAKIVQGAGAKDAGPSERWRLVKVNDAFRLVNEASGKTLEVPGANHDHGVQLIQWEAQNKGGQHQLWEFVAVGESYRLKVRHTGQYLTVGQGRMTPGASVVQWDLVDSADQFWILHAAGKSR
jgi:Ricin-type beta-trefoil lectin domain-like